MTTRVGEFRVDTKDLPLVYVHYPEEVGSDAAIERLWERYLELAESHSRLVFLIDMRDVHLRAAAASRRKRMGELYQQHVGRLARSCVGEARVVSSTLLRGVLTAFDWIKGESRWPCATFESEVEARMWLRARLLDAEE